MHIPTHGAALLGLGAGAPSQAGEDQSYYYAEDGQFGSGVATSGRSAELRAQASREMTAARNQFLASTEELRRKFQAALDEIVSKYRALGVDPGRS